MVWKLHLGINITTPQSKYNRQHGLLSTLGGGLHMDAWLQNWIDELDAEYEKLKELERKDSK